ncbi:tumor necrosis factor ligand superfamily member 10 isoform X3 [Varanus komodoensis]|uniref:tumor necrosis factor ligand superfamily member 10 isoform X3 n=1 Tax=Varanus komodoensis TaxID=61221 RepID=UPI001CF79EC3|nr:tumor necrosis factor ligand superfamily member 10 isoform X3 [Varanus komodoensis]XP_044290498.1 tumor necrosis factor ligand superfamily member 10 isoform X3 [Varanus komodoensis]XP_044290499.1 tumor necrosis factor ligand superfamily member 10 isoform X3 [Varanus komodoensis]XP_044290500.1 tumor necrosis factor ligand superfamily member 10 isoform X3 [Varanus komodoensis]XP_044290501.1 tumor necrosis factor ligand superfamily member 10 isoform X3 [Varanus komodoensis]
MLRETYSKSSFACFTRENFFLEDLDPNYNEDSDPCWQVKWQLSRLIKKMVDRNRVKEENSGQQGGGAAVEKDASEIAAPRVAAHVTANRNRKAALTMQNSSTRNSVGFKINTWETSRRGHSFLYNVELSNGELIIPQTGFYYIYSQTYFRFHESEDVEIDSDPGSDSVRNPKQMVQYIYKRNDYYPDPILIMKSARTSCWSKKAGYGLYSIYQGGVFQLQTNDRIFVSISNEELVDMDKEASFFGAFLVS